MERKMSSERLSVLATDWLTGEMSPITAYLSGKESARRHQPASPRSYVHRNLDARHDRLAMEGHPVEQKGEA